MPILQSFALNSVSRVSDTRGTDHGFDSTAGEALSSCGGDVVPGNLELIYKTGRYLHRRIAGSKGLSAMLYSHSERRTDMKRFLAIAAAALGIVACSQTGGVEPVEARIQEVTKPGLEERIAAPIRVTGPFSEVGMTAPGIAVSHGRVLENGVVVYKINCRNAPARCFLVDDDGGGATVWPIRGVATQQDIDNSTPAWLHYTVM